VGPTVGANFDPSHLFWMGVDALEMIADLGDAIYYTHAKDVSFEPAVVRRQGLVPAGDFADWEGRSWHYRAIGFGHPESFWREFVTALRRAGYDDVVVIELEEPFMSTTDALSASVANLRAVLPADPFPQGNWFDSYRWVPAEIE
jgi:sugar phosphate isomerase/epimerase